MTLNRVQYREGNRLEAADLNDEQAYRIAMRRRHNIAHHGWGIVSGLTLENKGSSVFLNPGMAIDGYGRELIVPETVTLPSASELIGKLSKDHGTAFGSAYVWLVYRLVQFTPAQKGRWRSGSGQYTREREEAWLRITGKREGSPRWPVGVPEQFGPHQAPPDGHKTEWPVFLGSVANDGKCDLSMRPYIYLIGNEITTPLGQTQIQLGRELGNDKNIFSITMADKDGEFVERMSIDQDAAIDLKGPTILKRDQTIGAESQRTSVAGLGFVNPRKSEAVATPWSMHTAQIDRDGVQVNQIRIEIDHPGDNGDPSRYQFMIGHFEEEVGFNPTLTVRSDRTVIAHGDVLLSEDSEIVEGPVGIDPNDPRFTNAMLGSYVGGISSAAVQVEAHYTDLMEVTLTIDDKSDVTKVRKNKDIKLAASIKNIGQFPLQNIRITIATALEDGNTTSASFVVPLLDPGLALSDGLTTTVSVPSVSGDKELFILVTAVALLPQGAQVQSSVDQTITIESSG